MGEFSLVAAGSLVLQGDKVLSNSLVAGVPAIVKRTLTPEEVEQIKASAERYVKYKDSYLGGEFNSIQFQVIDPLGANLISFRRALA